MATDGNANTGSGDIRDFYDLIPLPNGRLGILVADVSDKGMGAALYMALGWPLIRTYAVEFPSQPASMLGAVNRRIINDTYTYHFVTVFYGILDTDRDIGVLQRGSLATSSYSHSREWKCSKAAQNGYSTGAF